MIIMLTDTPDDPVRLAFPHLFTKPPGMQNADGSTSPPKFEATPIFRPDGENARRVREAIDAVAKEKYGTKEVTDETGAKVPAYKSILADFDDDQKGLRSGNKKKTKGGEIYDGFANMVYVVARNETRPTVINRDRSPVIAEDGVIYAGCYANLQIDIWALNKPGVKKRIVTDLLGVQFSREGDAFSSGAAPSDPNSFADLSAAEPAVSMMAD